VASAVPQFAAGSSSSGGEDVRRGPNGEILFTMIAQGLDCPTLMEAPDMKQLFEETTRRTLASELSVSQSYIALSFHCGSIVTEVAIAPPPASYAMVVDRLRTSKAAVFERVASRLSRVGDFEEVMTSSHGVFIIGQHQASAELPTVIVKMHAEGVHYNALANSRRLLADFKRAVARSLVAVMPSGITTDCIRVSLGTQEEQPLKWTFFTTVTPPPTVGATAVQSAVNADPEYVTQSVAVSVQGIFDQLGMASSQIMISDASAWLSGASPRRHGSSSGPWQSYGPNTACRLGVGDHSEDGEGTAIVTQASTLQICQQACELQEVCDGVEFQAFGRCELWMQPIFRADPVPGGFECVAYKRPGLGGFGIGYVDGPPGAAPPAGFVSVQRKSVATGLLGVAKEEVNALRGNWIAVASFMAVLGFVVVGGVKSRHLRRYRRRQPEGQGQSRREAYARVDVRALGVNMADEEIHRGFV